MAGKKAKPSWRSNLLGADSDISPSEDKDEGHVTFQPALRQIGITACPVCKHEVAVFLTKRNRPFIHCSFCSARIFYNGRVAQVSELREIDETGVEETPEGKWRCRLWEGLFATWAGWRAHIFQGRCTGREGLP